VLGRPIEVAAVSARSRSRKREIDISRFRWVDDPIEIAEDCSIDVLVELIGGSDGPAKRAVEAALARGAHVVTANKALLAEHGAELAALSEAKGGRILFEAAVAGGVPIVKALKESLAANRIRSVSGILNGTCNYLLTEMEASGRAYEDVLADAQRLGYAEADPTMDVGGYDAAHKISLLAAIAFGAAPDYGAVEIEGVDRITLRDIRLAGKLGYRIKLLAKAERLGVGVRVHVHPALLPMDHPLAGVSGALNAVVVDADPVGRLTFTGRGAGGGPTASAVAADLYELANGGGGPAFGQPVAALKTFATERKDSAADSRWFLRLLVQDRPGVIAAVSDRLGREGVSIESFLQQPNADEAAVPIVLTTRPCRRAALDAAVEAISSLDIVTEAVRTIAIDDGQA
jgi:homoserine dehydrogenase